VAEVTGVLGMVGASVGTWLCVAALVQPDVRLAVLLGLVGPLIAATVSWPVAEWTYKHRPDRLTRVMSVAFAGKMVFLGGYVAGALRGLSLSPVPFVASFTSYFIALHLAEALLLKRLFDGGSR